MPTCRQCTKYFPNRLKIDDKIVNVSSRKYCISCSPYGLHNTKQIEKKKELPVKHDDKTCRRCGKVLPSGSFHPRRNGTELSPYCKKCTALESLERQRLLKTRAVEYKGGKCVQCGYDRYIGALEFHHLNPEEKDSGISDIKTFEKMKPELDKCILVCSNCHKEIHYNMVGKDLDIESVRRKKDRFHNIHDIKIERDILEDLVCSKPTKDVAKEFGVGSYTIIKKCADLGIINPNNKKNRVHKKKFDIPKEELERLVWEKPVVVIARELGVSDSVIGKRCKKLGIAKPGRDYWSKQRARDGA